MGGSPGAGGPTRSHAPAARWLGGLLTAAVLLAAAPDPAAAQSYSGSPKLYRSSLNGATITLTGVYFGDGQAGNKSRYAILGWPASGAGTLSIGSLSTNSGAGTVTLTLAYTGTFVTDQRIQIRLNELVTSSGDHLTLGSIPVFVLDPGLAVGAVARPVAEYGTTVTFTVKLQTQPSAAVTVAVASQDTSEGRVSPASLLFSTSTWNTTQAVTVTGVDDTLTDNDQTWNVRLDPSSTDTAYNGLTNVDVAVTTLDDEGAPVVNSVAITSTPVTGDTYVLGETIAVRVGFDQSVTVTGTPQLALTVGTATRQAAYASGTGTAQLTFRYPVQAGDADGNGIAIGAAALTLNGGQIRLTGGTVSARLGLGTSALTDAAGHQVDAVHGPPGVRGVAISSPVEGTAFERGETIAVTVAFNKPVAVTGTPQLALTIGTATRQAAYAAGASTATALIFRYTVVQADADADGLSIGAGALALNGGTIRQAGSPTVNAELGLGFRAIANSAAHRVTGGTFTTPAITAIRITSTPVFYSSRATIAGLAYREGEVIEFTVTFSRPVTVTGTPILRMDLPSTDNYASVLYVSGTGTRRLVFHYTVAPGHIDDGNVAIQGNDLLLNGGTINDARDSTTAANLAISIILRNNVTIQNHDIDGALLPTGITLSQSTLAVTEGSTGSYTVSLNRAPASDVVVTATRSSTLLGLQRPLDATWAAAATLTFTATTWNTGQMVRVRGEADADAASGRATITHAVVDDQSANAFDNAPDQVLAVTVTDDEQAAIRVSPSRLDVREGAEAAYTVRLSHVPTGNVRVLLISSDKEEARVSTTAGGPYAGDWSVRFTPTTWNTGQRVYVEGRADADFLHEDETIRHTVYPQGSADEYAAVTAVLPVTILDAKSLVVTPRAVTVREGSGTGVPYTVALNEAPGGAVTVTASVAGGSTVVALDADASPQTRVLTFTTANWNTAQTVTVTPTSDADDADAEDAQVTVTHTPAAGSGNAFTYAAQAAENVTVTIEDDETAAVVVSATSLTLYEDPNAGGGTNRHVGTYTMRLGSQITGSGSGVFVQIINPSASKVQVRTATESIFDPGVYTVSFTPSNWNTAQTVTVTAQADADGRDEEVVLNNEITAVDADARMQGYVVDSRVIAVADTTVTVVDDEEPALVVDTDPGTSGVQTAALAVTEGGGTAAAQAYTVALGLVPTGPVTVSVASGTTSAVTVAPTALTFTTTTWQTAQPVTATAADDADGNHETVTVTHTLTGASEYAGLAANAVASVTVQVTDDEAPRAGITAPATLTQAALNTAQVQVALTNATWTAGVQTGAAVGDYFALDTTVPGLTLEAIASVPSTTTATLDLAYDGTNFDTARTLRVRVLAAAHTGSEDVLTGPVPVTPTPGLTIVPTTGLRTTESGGTAVFTVRLATAPTATVVLGLASANTAEGTVLPTALTFDAAAWQTAQPVTLTGVDDATATPPNPADGTQSYRITLTVNQAATADAVYDGMAAVTLTAFNQDNEYGLAVGSVTGAATEAGGPAAFTVALQTEPTNAVTVAVASQDPGEGRAAPGQLVFTTTIWETDQTVTVTGEDDPADDGDVVWAVGLTTSSSDTNYDGLTEDVAVTTTDDDDPPGVTLTLSAATLTESGAGSTATVTATLTHPSGAATTVTVTAGSAYTVGPDAVIVIAAGETAAPTDGAAIIAVANATDEPDRTATVTATVGNARAAADGTTMTVTGAALTVRDDDPAPNAALTLTPTTIAENGGQATVTATLDRPSSEPTTVTVNPVPGTYTVGPGAAATIVLAAGATANAADLARITAVDDTIHQGSAATHRTATVTATLTNPHGAGTVATGPTLTLTDDETQPTVTLALMPAAIAETGEVATVTATLSGASGQAVTLTVTTTAVSPAVAGDVTQSGTTLTIAAGATTSTGLVTLTTVDNSVQTGSKSITVAGAATGGHGVTAPADATLTLTDDDTPLPTLILTPAVIAENGGTATVTATLNITSTAVVTVTVAAAPDQATGAVAGDFTLSTDATLTFAAGATTSTGLVTLTAVNNETDAPAKRVTVSGTADDLTGSGLPNAPAAVTLTLTDDDPAPNATLTVTPPSITEAGGSAAVQATLDRPSSAPTTVTVTPVAGAYTVGVETDAFIAIAAGTTSVVGDVASITGVDDNIHQGTAHRTPTVTAELTNPQGAGTVAGATLTLTDDETLPTVMLAVTPTAVTEAGGMARVTATLSGPSSQPTTLTVAAAAVAPAVAGDFTLSTAMTLTIAAATTTSTGTVTVTAVDNAVDLPDKQVTVTATAAGGHGVAAPSAAALTLTDDDVAGLTVDPVTSTTLRLRTSEDGDTATVRVRLATAPTATVVLDLASSDTTEGTVAPATLTFTAMTWNTAQPVTLTGVDDAPANLTDGNQVYTVTLTANASSTTDDTYDSVTATVYATNRDNEFGLDVGDVTGQATEAGGQATFLVALLTNPGAAVTVAVASQDPTEGTVAPSVLVFTPDPSGTWQTPQTVTVTGVDDAVDDGDVPWTVRLTTTSSSGNNYDGLDEDVAVTTTDNDDAPTVTLVLMPPAITENGGVATVTATLSYASSEATAVTVTATPVSPAVVGDYTLSTTTNTVLTIAAEALTSEGTVTLTAEDNDVDAPNKTVTVTGTAANARASRDGMTISVTPATLTLEDDDERGFAFNPAALVVAAGSTAAYTVALTSEPTGAVTVTLNPDAAVTVAPGLTFTATSWNTAQSVTLTVATGTTAPTSLVEHRGAGGDYEGETTTLVVARMAVPGEAAIDLTKAVQVVEGADGRFVPVRVTGAAPAGATIRPRQALTGPLTVTIKPLAADRATDAAGTRFRFGPPASPESWVALDIAVTPPQPARLCLPVREEVRRAAGARRVHLLHDRDGDGKWTVVAEGPSAAPELCAEVLDFSPFAVGYADRAVALVATEGEPRTYYTGRPVTDDGVLREGRLTTAEYDPLTYTLTPALPAESGLSYTPPAPADRMTHGGTITGTPPAPMAKRKYTLTVTDADGDMATLTFEMEVKPGIESRDLALVLAGVGRTLASDAVEILGSRAGPPPARLHVTLGGQVLRLTDPAGSAPAASPVASGTPSPLASAPSPLAGEGRGEGADAAAPAATSGPSPWQRVTGVAVGVARALGVTLDTPALPSTPAGAAQSDGSTFPSAQTILARAPADPRRPSSPTWRSPLSIQPVSAKDLLARSAFELPLTRTDADGLPTWTLWGRGAASGFSGQPEEGFKMDGTLYSGYLGLDYRQASLLMGLAVAHSTGTVDYERTGGTKAGVDVQLTSLLPYAHWQPYAGLGVWGLLGAGLGEMDLKAAGDPTPYTTALTSWLGAVGGRQALTTWQGIDLAAKTDAFLTTVRSEAKTNLPGARGHAERVRLLLEGQTAVTLSPVSRVQPRLEVGGRWDSGTAEQGLGLELGGGLAYTQTEWGLSVAMQGRYLLVHEDGAFEDWGASVNVRLDPGIGGEGAYLTVAPVWGQPGSGVEQVWGTAAAVPGGTTPARVAGWRPANVEVDVGYGLALADGRGLLTPYGGLVLGDPGTARYRLGSRWAMSALLDLSVEGERAEQPGQASAHSVSVRLGWQW